MSAIVYSPTMNSRSASRLFSTRVQATGLAHVAIDRVRNLLGRVQAEVMVLARHRPEIRHLPEQPLDAIEPRRASSPGMKRPILSAR